MLYHLHEYQRSLLAPASVMAQAAAKAFSSPQSWFAQLPGASRVAAGYELFHRLAKRYDKPSFGIDAVEAHGARVAVLEETVLAKPFCRLLRFARYADRPELVARLAEDAPVLVVAPLSGHHATLLREAARTLLADHTVYVTDWIDARLVPLAEGSFTLDDYVAYVREFMRHIGTERLHVLAVCQPAVPVLAAAALTAAAGEPEPRSLVLMGGPIDTRQNPTDVNRFATTRPLSWFETNLLHETPAGYPGRGRRVYPGFLQHAGFIAMNPVRHASAHLDFYADVARGEHGDAEEHRRFYDEYNAVLDMPAEYYIDCVRVVFQQHLLPRGLWRVGGERVAPEAITCAALMTVEGEKDDISGLGQTRAAHGLATGIPAHRKEHLTVMGAGHYGIFSGRRWREIVYPRMRAFLAAADGAPARRRVLRTA
ncbi:MAG TPA: polyhydroxyalkanoate depolymerase [Polyangia bacterium]|nr:polyhydroxyalkanoate depolymerase [Polyangia bacterium]